jgi:hypothetical protein
MPKITSPGGANSTSAAVQTVVAPAPLVLAADP